MESRHTGALALASAELERFSKSPRGQALLRDVRQCLADVEKMARLCRDRNRISSGIRAAGGLTIAAASATALVAGSIVATAGTSAPVVAGATATLVAAGSVAGVGIV